MSSPSNTYQPMQQQGNTQQSSDVAGMGQPTMSTSGTSPATQYMGQGGMQYTTGQGQSRTVGGGYSSTYQQSSTTYTQGGATTMPTYTGGSSSSYQYGGGPSTTPTVTTGQERIQSERIMSSTVIGEHHLNAAPEDSVQYIEVPVYEEVVRHVPKKEIVEIEKRVPRYEYEWVERIVEIPQIQVVEKHVEVPQIQEVIKHVPVRQVVDVAREVVRCVPKIQTKIVEQEVEVVGETIEVPKPYLVENRVVVPRYVDKEIPTVVAQRMHPIITESETDFVDVELKEYNPQLVSVDVYIPRPITRNLIAAAKYEEHRVVDVPPAQYNALVKSLNGHIAEKDTDAIYVKMQDGSIPMLHGAGSSIISPLSSEWEKFHQKGQQHIIYTPGMIMPGTQTTMTTQQQTTTTVGGVTQQRNSTSQYSTQQYTGGAAYPATGTSYQTGTPYTGGAAYTGGSYQASSYQASYQSSPAINRQQMPSKNPVMLAAQ